MKKFIVFLFAGILACNDGKKEEEPKDIEQVVPRLTQLKNAVQQYPDSLILKENLIQYYRDSSYYDSALLEVNRALERDDRSARLWDIKAVLHFENEDTLASIAAFEKSLSISANPANMISLGMLYAETRNKKAIEFADTLLSQHKEDAAKQALFIKGLYYSFSNDKLKAIQFFDQCIGIDHTFMDAYREKGIALYDLGKYNEAIEVLNKAVTFQNSFDEGYYYLGRCFEKLNRVQEAIESYQAALMYDPEYTEARDALRKLGVKE